MIYHLLLKKNGYLNALRIITNDKALKKDLFTYFSPFVTYLSDNEVNNYPTFEFYNNGGVVSGFYNGVECDVEDPLLQISKIISKIFYSLENVIVLHGALLERNGEGIIIIAPSGTGKTTLSMYLTDYGFKYISDDYVVITEDGKYTHNIVTPMRLRQGGINVLQKENLCFSRSLMQTFYGNKERYIYIPRDDQISLYKNLPVKLIVNIYRDEVNYGSQKMSKIELFNCLLSNSAVSKISNTTFMRKYAKMLDIDGVFIQYNNFKSFLQELNKYL